MFPFWLLIVLKLNIKAEPKYRNADNSIKMDVHVQHTDTYT